MEARPRVEVKNSVLVLHGSPLCAVRRQRPVGRRVTIQSSHFPRIQPCIPPGIDQHIRPIDSDIWPLAETLEVGHTGQLWSDG